MEMADMYPEADVTGIDLSPIQPKSVPPRLKFFLKDLEEDWDEYGKFDLIHLSGINGIPVKDWSKFFRQAFNSLDPGGWVECHQLDLDFRSDFMTVPEDTALRTWARCWKAGLQRAGYAGQCCPRRMIQQMAESGFEEIRCLPFKLPIGPWSNSYTLREAGLYTRLGLLEGLHGMSARVFLQHLPDWHDEEMQVLLSYVRTELTKLVQVHVPA